MQRKTFEPVTLTPKQVSDRYGVSMGTLANWRCQKTGPKYYKQKSMVLYKTTDVEAFLLSSPVLTKDSIEA